MRLARSALLLLACSTVVPFLAVALGGCGAGKGAARRTSSSTSAPARTSTAPTSGMPPTARTAAPPASREVAPPASREVAPGVVRASSAGIAATMHASSHHPRANRPWPVSFAVSRAGRPLRAAVSYEYLFAGQVVARRSHYRFSGSFHDTFIWPTSAVGYPLTFRALIAAAGTTLSLDYAVQVSR